MGFEFKPAGDSGLDLRLSVIIIATIAILALAVFSPGGGIFRDWQALFSAIVLVLFIGVAATGMPLTRTPAHLAFGAFTLVSLLAVATSVWRVESLLEVGTLLGYLALFFLGANIVGRERLRLSAHLLVIVGAAVAVAGIVQYFGDPAAQIESLRAMGLDQQANQLASMSNRAYANFSSANSFAGFLLLIIPVNIGLILYERDLRVRAALTAALAIIGVGFFLAFSKGALLALIVALAVFPIGAYAAGRIGRVWLGLPALTAAGGFLYVFGALFHFNVSSLVANVGGRVELWRVAAELVKSAPLLGVGPGAFGTQMAQFQVGSVFSRYAHNTYLQVAAETGVLGLLAFMVLLGTVIVVGWRQFRSESAAENWLRLGLLGSAVGFAVHNFVDYTWYVSGVALAFWFIAGLATSETGERMLAGAHPTTGRSLIVAVMALGLVPAIIVYTGASTAYNATQLESAGADQALEQYEKSLTWWPYNADAHDRWGRVIYTSHMRYGIHDDPNLLRHQRQAISLRPTWPYYHSRLADTLALFGKEPAALREYKRAAALAPKDPVLWVQGGNYLLGRKEYAQALEMFRSATALGPVYQASTFTAQTVATAREDFRGPLLGLGFGYLGTARAYVGLGRPRAAERALGKAEGLLGDDPWIAFARGQIAESRGDDRAARRAYTLATKAVSSSNPVFSLALATLLERTGDLEGARRELDALLDVDSNHKDAKRLRERLSGS